MPTERLAKDVTAPRTRIGAEEQRRALALPGGPVVVRLCVMETSQEIANILARLLDAIRDGDEQAVSNRFSRQPGFERYGPYPAEHWQDGDEAVLVLVQQIRETGGFLWKRVGDIHAMSEGTVGWASGEMEFETALGSVPYRVSCVLHLEHGDWKVVQWLSVVPATNESYGFLLTTSVDDIAVSVQAAGPTCPTRCRRTAPSRSRSRTSRTPPS